MLKNVFLTTVTIIIVLLVTGCNTLSESSPDTPCKTSYDRYMEVQNKIRPTNLLEYKEVNTLEELKSFEKDYEVSEYGDYYSPSQRYGGMTGKKSDFKPTYVFAIKQEATSTMERNRVHLCICIDSIFSCGN